MYNWPLEEIKAMCDPTKSRLSIVRTEFMLQPAGLNQSLVNFLAPLFNEANGATFFDGAFRIHPLGGMVGKGIPDLIAWNDKSGWKQYEPKKDYDTFYFCSNAFGDLFGIPINTDGSILRDQIGILWVERYEYQEAVIEWRDFFYRIITEPEMAKFFLRLDEYAWATSLLRKPAAWECYSSNVPALLGGSDLIENIDIQSLVVHVPFTLQVIRQAREQTDPSALLPLVDLYDENGRLID